MRMQDFYKSLQNPYTINRRLKYIQPDKPLFTVGVVVVHSLK